VANGHSAEHVFDLKMDQAADVEIWQQATKTGAVIVTKDDDFIILSRVRPGPSILWITIGNCSKQHLLNKFERSFSVIEKALNAGEILVELR